MTSKFNKNPIPIDPPYVFMGKHYEDVYSLFIELMKPESYEAGIEEWQLGNISVAINKNKITEFQEIHENIQSIPREGRDEKMQSKIQLAILYAWLDPEARLFIDGEEVLPNNLEKFISYFVFLKRKEFEDNDYKTYLAISEIMILMKDIIGNSKLIKKLDTLKRLIHRFSDSLTEYQLLLGNPLSNLEKEIFNLNENKLKQREWAVNVYYDLVELADFRQLVFDRDKAMSNISKFEAICSLSTIDNEVRNFKRKYKGVRGKWSFLYNKKKLSELESLLLLSVPEDFLIIKSQKIIFFIYWLLVILSMIGLITIPYYLSIDRPEDTVHMIKIDSGGEDWVSDVKVAQDRKFVVGGYTSGFGWGKNDFWVLGFDHQGKLEWSKTVGGELEDDAYTLVLTKDQGFLIAGYTSSLSSPLGNSILVKFDRTGKKVWEREYNIGEKSEVLGLRELFNGRFVITGRFIDTNGFAKMYIVQTQSDGEIRWIQKIDKIDGYGVAVVENRDQQIMVLGNFKGKGRQRDMVVFGLDENGEFLWEKQYLNCNIDHQKLVLTIPDGVILSGQGINAETEEPYMVVHKLDYFGNLIWSQHLIEQNFSRPVSLSRIESSEMKQNYLLLGERFKPGDSPKNIFFNFNNKGDYVLIRWDDTYPVQNSAWGLWRDGEIFLVGSDVRGSEEKDVWVIRKKLDITLP